MKITKEQGRACLESVNIDPIDCPPIVKKAWSELGWGQGGGESLFDIYMEAPTDESMLALAMCAAIAGVRP